MIIMEKMLNNFVGNLKEIFRDRLSSVFLYGSRAVEEGAASSDVNLMVIIKDLAAKDLKSAHKVVKKISKKTKSLPIFMDKDEWFNSCDVYAIEYSDIKERNKILFGEDLISGLNVEKNNLRLQCEREVKNLLIKLRQTYLAKATDKRALENLIKMSSKTFMVIFRTILSLTNEAVPKNHNDVIKLFGEKIKNHEIEFDCEMFLKIIEFREKSKSLKGEKTEIVVQKLIDTTNSVLKYVDKINS